MFVLQNAPHAAAFPDLRLIPEESVGSTGEVRLLLALRLGDEGAGAALEYGRRSLRSRHCGPPLRPLRSASWRRRSPTPAGG